MNILMVGPSFKAKGGIATVIANFRKYYRSNKIVYLETWQEKHRYFAGIRALFVIRKKIRQEKIDIVHFHVAQKGSFYRKALLSYLVPRYTHYIFHMHASQFDLFYEKSPRFLKKRIRDVLNRADHIVVLSESWASFYRGLTKTPISVIPNAVEVSKEANYDSDAKKIIMLGRQGERKGSYDVLKIAPLFPDYQFVLYGDGEIERLTKEIKRRNIQNVTLPGWLDSSKRDEVLSGAVLHLLISYNEGLPMSILETMSRGIPNLATGIGGIPEAIKDGENGFLVAPGDLQQIQIYLKLFLNERELRISLSKQARLTVENRFSIESYFSEWSALYDASIYKKEKD
ncbi:glycosyltransferase family 4 protein [Listeria aquatica]|uniref:Glycosyltransferase family 4 protein n=1 Tax=Listeria aquatica TaxID=1494960 RepID=A0A841ZLX2_9LIST|nr:glycosyltransferase family 4 protein [Listeria aquatica]MBC1520517.1 glycosyltransferase family 4 protein [Listeria aquatica]